MIPEPESPSLYIHVPFCARKCGYCDFYSIPAATGSLVSSYIEALVAEIAAKATGEPAATVYFGGGTPTLLAPGQVEEVMRVLRKAFRIAAEAEVSMEANPETVDEGKLAGFRAAGVNRVSIGIQSLDDPVLRTLGRIHDAERARAAVREAAAAGFGRIGVDLMFGLPGQSPEGWRSGLREVLGWPVEHLSAYELTVEEGTPFAAAGHALPSEEEVALMWEITLDEAARAGFVHYEVSNYARPGAECRHNLVYWNDGEFLGFGPAAWSSRGGTRTGNPRDLGAWLEGRAAGFPPAETESLPAGRRAAESLVLALRMTRGCDAAAFDGRWGAGALARFDAALAPHFAAGRLERVEGRLRLTRKGMLVANDVWSDLVGTP